MIETMQQVESFFKSRKELGIKPGLDRINQLLEMLGNPQDQMQAIHIAGTNGKGSTLHYLNDALQMNGYQVGVFTSPSFTGLRGHMFINDIEISEEVFISILNDIYHSIQQLDGEQMHPTEFEIITVMSFVYFANHVDIALIEAGMGGREDTTNCFQPIMSIITNIARDHTAFLGDTIKAIASHKAGIIKHKRPVIIGNMKQDALNVIKEEARLKQTKVYQLGDQFTYKFRGNDETGQCFSWYDDSSTVFEVGIQMRGEHQLKNTSIAIMALVKLAENGYKIIWKLALAGLRKTVIPGRFEVIQHNPTVIADGAHNPAGVASFLQTVSANYDQKDKHLIFAAFKDKELKTMLDQLSKHFTTITLTSFDHPRAASAEALYHLTEAEHKCRIDNWQEAIDKINNTKSPVEQCYFITGSLHFISSVRKYITENRT